MYGFEVVLVSVPHTASTSAYVSELELAVKSTTSIAADIWSRIH